MEIPKLHNELSVSQVQLIRYEDNDDFDDEVGGVEAGDVGARGASTGKPVEYFSLSVKDPDDKRTYIVESDSEAVGGCCYSIRNKSNYSFNHKDPSEFVSSQWDRARPSLVYLMYRLMFSLYFMVWLPMSFLMSKGSLDSDTYSKEEKFYFFIYMTNWGFTLITVDLVVQTIITLEAWINRSQTSWKLNHSTMPLLYKISWILELCSSISQVVIAIVYWSILHDYSVPGVEGINNVSKHLLGAVYTLSNVFITARPVRIHHFYVPLIFINLFAVFSLIYWLAGGTTLSGRSYIYPITDYSRPGLVAGAFVGIAIFVLMCQTFFWCLYRLRLKLYYKIHY